MTVPAAISALLEQSQALERAGDLAAALQQARQALDLARADGPAEATAAALATLSHVHFRQGRYAEARALAERALQQASPESRARVDALLMLGLCAAETDDPAAAEAFYHQAASLARLIGYHRALQRALHNLAANVYVLRGQFQLALAADGEAFRLAQEQHLPELAWAPLASMGWVYWAGGQHEQAAETAAELERLAVPGSLAEGFAAALQGDLALERGDPDQARARYARARAIAETIGDPGLNVLLRLGLCRCERRFGELSAAGHWATDALYLARRVNYHHLQGMALIERGRVSADLADRAAAGADLQDAIDLLQPLQADFDLARAYLLLAGLLFEHERAQAKSAWLEAGRRIATGGYAFLLERERALAFPLIAAFESAEDPELRQISSALLALLEGVPPPPLHVSTLGRFEVHRRGRPIPDSAWRQRRAGELFRLLLVSPGRSLYRDQVAEALWPDKAPSSTPALFHQATSALRRALEPDLPEKFPSRYLQVDGGQATLHLPEGSWVDGEAFAEHVREQEWAQAQALYQGPLFPQDRYADWAAAPREHLARLYLRALLESARQALAQGRPQEALGACRRALELEPWQEQAVRMGMQACLDLNDRAGAHRLYQDLERRLDEELGIAPDKSLQDFYQSLL
ncbi:MAG: tetratricopeptide repeat protein [Chloroflexia bacterium]|nr:tetratricopeptide repeat protein [Chloroflexia bacterium]